MWEITLSIISGVIAGVVVGLILYKFSYKKDEAIKSILQDLLMVNNLQQNHNNIVHMNVIHDQKESTKLILIDLDQSELNQNLKGRIVKL